MKTAISIPDEIFEEAEAEAERLGVSRSQLYVTAIKRFLDERRSAWITERLNEVYRNDEPDPAEQEFMMSMARAAFERSEW